MAEFYDVDPEKCSREELMSAISKCGEIEEYYHTLEQSCKTFINSMYGAVGSNMYNCSNVDVAESITLQGQNLIKFSVMALDAYFRNTWQKDIRAHEMVGIKMLDIFPEFDYEKFVSDAATMTVVLPGERRTLQIYGDTDSAYVSIQFLMDMYSIPIEMQTDFVLAIHSEVLDSYLDMAFGKYAEKFNCPKNVQKLELEKIARSVIMIAKKNYIMDISWTDSGSHISPLHKLVYKGIEVVKSSTPNFVRASIIDFIKSMLEIIDAGRMPDYSYIVSKISDYKRRFSMQSPNEVSVSKKISEYEKFILNDKSDGGIIYSSVWDEKKNEYVPIVCPQHVKAAAIYNNMMYTDKKASKYRSKYGILHAGDKVRYYYVYSQDRGKNDDRDVFGFIPDQFPAEIAPKMDYDYQFEKLILSPLNRIVTTMGFIPVNASVSYSEGLW